MVLYSTLAPYHHTTKTCQNGKSHKPIDNFQGMVDIILIEIV